MIAAFSSALIVAFLLSVESARDTTPLPIPMKAATPCGRWRKCCFARVAQARDCVSEALNARRGGWPARRRNAIGRPSIGTESPKVLPRLGAGFAGRWVFQAGFLSVFRRCPTCEQAEGVRGLRARLGRVRDDREAWV